LGNNAKTKKIRLEIWPKEEERDKIIETYRVLNE